MSWNELSEDELSQVSYPETASGVVIMRRPGVPKIYVERQVPRGSKGFLLRISPEFHDDMRHHVVGSLTTAITAILEEQFDVLKSGNQEWHIVEGRRPK